MTPNLTLKEQVEEILWQFNEEFNPKCVKALLTLITADRKAHSEAMVGAVPEQDVKHMHQPFCSCDKCSYRQQNDDEAVGWNQARQALLQASAHYQEGKGV